MIQDLTKADGLQQQLRRAEEERARLAAIVESSDDAIIGKTLEGIITSWNRAAERIFEYRADEIIGHSILRIIPASLHDDEARILSKLRRGERVEHYETQRVAKSGRVIEVSLTSSPIRDSSGSIIGASKIARDITDQKSALRASLHLAAIVDSSEDAIISKTLEGKVTSWNKAAEKVFGYTADEMIGQHITRLFPQDRLEEEPGIIARISAGQRIEHFETIRKTKDGRLIDISLTLSPIRDVSGKVIGASKIARDISHRKRLEVALQKAKDELELRVKERTASLQETTEQLETFCYTVAHDLRSPLRAQQGFAQALLEDYGHVLDEDGLNYARRIVVSAQRLDQLVQDLLTYSRISRTELQFTGVDLSKVIADAQTTLSEDIRKAGAVITVGNTHSVSAYPPTLNLIVTNLLSNAIKFVDKSQKPRVNFHSEAFDGRVRLWVEDNGIGIAPEFAGKIFGIFNRLHGLDQYPGTGIGLAIVQKGIQRMGGNVGLESSPGKGSRFWIDLPANREIDFAACRDLSPAARG